MIVQNIDLKIVQGSRGPDHEDMGSWVGPPPSSNHFPSARSTDFARRLSVGRQSVVWVSLCHEGSLFEDGSDVPFFEDLVCLTEFLVIVGEGFTPVEMKK